MSFEAIIKRISSLKDDFLAQERMILIITTLLALRAVMYNNWNEANFFLLCGFIVMWEVRWVDIKKRTPPTILL